MGCALRPELPELPARMQGLPVDHRGYPVPWFAAWVDDDGNEVARGQGRADHRITAAGAQPEAIRRGICWQCGQHLGAHKVFVVGPMCTVNRTSGEPPSHRECADFAVRGCPFLTRPHARRREAGMPEDGEMPGVGILRNPGVMALWHTKRFEVRRVHNGILLTMGDPLEVTWWTHGRSATPDEIEASFVSGLPALQEMAVKQGPLAVAQLRRQAQAARSLVPA